jgi:hypothetical protein
MEMAAVSSTTIEVLQGEWNLYTYTVLYKKLLNRGDTLSQKFSIIECSGLQVYTRASLVLTLL